MVEDGAVGVFKEVTKSYTNKDNYLPSGNIGGTGLLGTMPALSDGAGTAGRGECA